MASFISNLWGSVFEPGTNGALIFATHASFACLQATLASLLYATRSYHFLFLSVISAGLWMAITWFVSELEKVKEWEREGERIRKLREGEKEGKEGKEE